MAGYGFRRDINNSRLDIEHDGNDVLQISSTVIVLPSRMTGGFSIADRASVTQQTNKTTGVTCDALVGTITMNNAALAAAAEVTFVVTCARVDSTDVVVICQSSVGASLDDYVVGISAVGGTTFNVVVGNVSAGSLSEAIVLTYMILKSA